MIYQLYKKYKFALDYQQNDKRNFEIGNHVLTKVDLSCHNVFEYYQNDKNYLIENWIKDMI